MTIHRVRLVYSEGGAQSFNNWLETWLANMDPWAERPNDIPTRRDGPDMTTPHYRGDLSFAWSADRSIIEEQLTGYLSSYCDWSIVGYHVCDHDESDRGRCTWESVTEHGAVPSEVSL